MIRHGAMRPALLRHLFSDGVEIQFKCENLDDTNQARDAGHHVQLLGGKHLGRRGVCSFYSGAHLAAVLIAALVWPGADAGVGFVALVPKAVGPDGGTLDNRSSVAASVCCRFIVCSRKYASSRSFAWT